ncbi:hypothetical protein PoB_003618600 [Plakobranchus ocellatus]|uniref:Uncharacterized protein n=1 Tax=Plakobranchus ocellatus TaxID=259542 RepID=A0AAV4ANC4_9GAST|nr:hypothetical protein PoB_003618600 [Plakobranchus ocellatus]
MKTTTSNCVCKFLSVSTQKRAFEIFPVEARCQLHLLLYRSVVWSLFGSALVAERINNGKPNKFKIEFAINCATIMPLFFKETASLQDSVSSIRIRYPRSRTRQVTVPRSSDPRVYISPGNRGGRVQAQFRLRTQSQFD